MAQRLYCLILFPLLFFSCPILSSSSSSSSSLLTLKVNLSSTVGQRLNHTSNLSSGVNSGSPSFRRLPDAVSSSLVERQFRLPVLGHPGVQNVGHYAGYYRLPRSKNAKMFYFFFESRNNKSSDPIVIWLAGGPGISGSISLFYENGPYHVNNNSLIWNDFGWDQISNFIYVDQPTGTGFSYSSDQSDIRTNEEEASNDLYDFLQVFYDQHPQYLKNDFYIAGQSYAGHFISVLASQIHNGNKNKDGAPINFKGFAIGNGYTDPLFHYQVFSEYAFTEKLITESQAIQLDKFIPTCKKDIAKCNAKVGGVRGGERDHCDDAYSSCSNIFNVLMSYLRGINYFDTRKKSVGRLCYDFSYIEKLLNKESVRKALGVGDIKFVPLSTTVYYAMIKDSMRNYAARIPPLLEDGIKVLIYAGEYDLMCNWLGIYRWVDAMKWSGQEQFNVASMVPYKVDGTMKGYFKEYGPLSFLKFNDAGHMVPMDQPRAALEMMKRWTQGTGL